MTEPNEQSRPAHPPANSEQAIARQQHESHLRESEEKYRRLFESSRDAIMILYPPDWNFIACNPATVTLFGARDEAHFTSLGPGDVSPEYQPDGELSMVKARKAIEAAMREGFHLFEWMHKQVGGPNFLTTVQLTRITLQGVEGLQATVRDITEQRRAETELRAYATFQRAILDSAGYAIISCRPDGIIQLFNPAAEALLGYSADELIGRQHPGIFHDPEEVGARARQLSDEFGSTIAPGFDVFIEKCRRNLPNEHEWTYIRKDGTRRTVLLNVTAMRDADGEITGYLGVASDVTPLKRTAQELLLAKEVAEAANRTKSQFLANMSHEIRTPMNGVLGMTELLLSTTLDTRQRHVTRTIQQSGEALLAIINDILDFSKIEAGKLQLEQLDFDVQETVENAVELFAGPAQRKHIELTCQVLGPFTRALRGDPIRLRQALLNLTSNALKFTANGEINVRVSAVTETPTTVTLRFEVKDSGVGIPAEAHQRIFEAFSQADGTTTRRFGGTGLGLTIVKELVALMQGQIGVESQVGRGSTFWFTAVFERQPAVTPGQEQVPERALIKKRILVVDDTAANREILDGQLRSWGALSTLAASAQEALVLLGTGHDSPHPFDLVILDLHMPDMDGLELARAIRANPRLTGLPLLMLTSVGYDDSTPGTPHLDAWVTKPVRNTLLRQALLGLLQTRHHAPVQPPPAPPLATGPIPFKAARLLLVEDTPVNREVAIGMLDMLGHFVQAVENGRLAVEAVAKERFDLILMDCQMPDMDGFTATTAIRQQEREAADHRHVPIIALTANAMEGDRTRCLAAGMDDYLAKPFTMAQLSDMLTQWLTSPTAVDSTKPASSPPACPDHAPSDQPPSSSVAEIDKAAWDAILALQRPGRPDILARVLTAYLNDSPILVEEIRTAVRAQDPVALAKAAHRLKSSSAQLGALATAAHCKELENLGRLAHLEGAAGLLAQLTDAHQAACAAMTSELLQRTAA
ncbi:MAG: response regulator [Nitrospira sp. CR1.1]|jgi:PAS domain S-box-containing protein|nr:response regulator [Nitrospira sp. CR1.1]